MSFKISNTPVTYYPDTGESFRENPLPLFAKQTRGKGSVAEDPLRAAGLYRVNWEQVLDFEDDAIKYFQQTMGMGKLLGVNEKTKKPRPSGQRGLIVGLALMPHYYINMLNTIDVADSGMLDDVDIQEFNTFRGRTAREASIDSNMPQQELLNFCTKASAFCRSSCLIFTGNNPKGPRNATSKARKSYALLENPELFVAALRKELISFARNAYKKGFDPVVRLNMLSDIPWYELCPELLIEGSEEHGIFWYDYTKIPFWRKPEYHEVSDILDLTFSFSGSNHKECEEALKEGYRIALCFAPKNPERRAAVATRTSFQEVSGLGRRSGLITKAGKINLFGGSWDFIDGDSSDYRIDDPAPSIVCLNFKEPAFSPYDPTYEALWKYVPEARSKFSMQVEDPERLGEIYSAARRSEKFAKHLAKDRGIPLSKVSDAVKRAKLIDSMPFEEVIEDFLAFEGRDREAWLERYEKDVARKDLQARKRAAETAALSPEQLTERRAKAAEAKRIAAARRKADKLAKEALAGGLPVSMFPIEDTKILVGPHVPLVLED